MVPIGERRDTPGLTVAEMREHLASIVNSTDDAIVSKDLNGTIQSWNPAAERLFGYTAEEAVGQPIYIILPEDRKDEEAMILARIRRGEKISHFETIRRRKDGSLINVQVTISPIRDEDGKIIGASKIGRDITDRKANEAAKALLAAIVDSSDDAIVSKNLDGIVTSWNKGAERLFGYMAEEMIGQPILKIIPADRQEEEARILGRLRRGEDVDHFETVRCRKDGSKIEVSVTISPIRDGSGKIVGASKVARDIGDRKALEAMTMRLKEELEQRVKDRTLALEDANKEMEAFTHSIAHDLRGPLRAIISTCAMLEEDFEASLPKDAQNLLIRQRQSAKRLSNLIEDLLRYSRIGRQEIVACPIDLADIAREVWHEIKPLSTNCTLAVADSLPANGDRGLIKIVLQNLIDNACKFSPEGGEVQVGKTGHAFFVRDHGVGFDMAFAEKIFMPFERLVRNDEFPGTGIGLASVKRIMERHGGTIWAGSNPGQGTTFFFTLPEPKPAGVSLR